MAYQAVDEIIGQDARKTSVAFWKAVQLRGLRGKRNQRKKSPGNQMTHHVELV